MMNNICYLSLSRARARSLLSREILSGSSCAASKPCQSERRGMPKAPWPRYLKSLASPTDLPARFTQSINDQVESIINLFDHLG